MSLNDIGPAQQLKALPYVMQWRLPGRGQADRDRAACALQAAVERSIRENNALAERNQRVLRELQEQAASNARLIADNKAKATELKQKEEAVRALQAETAKVVKAKEAALARIEAIKKQKEDVEKVNGRLRCCNAVVLAFVKVHHFLHRLSLNAVQ